MAKKKYKSRKAKTIAKLRTQAKEYDNARIIVRILAALFIFLSILSIVSAIILFINPDKVIESLRAQLSEEQLKILQESQVLNSQIIITIGVFILIFSIFTLIVSISLWKFKNWARITVVVLSGLAFLLILISLFSKFKATNILDLFISVAVFYLFALNKNIVRLFR